MTALSQHQDFAPFVGRQFGFEGQRIVLHLAKVQLGAPYTIAGTQRTPFTLIFHGPAGDVLPEGMVRTHIEDGPQAEFYIMPIHTIEPGRQDYQAVFN
jgi:hypothetical protein